MSKKRNNKAINGYLLVVIMAVSLLITLLFGYNILSISSKKGGGSGTTVELGGSGSSMKNDYYVIGNNPTEINKESFKDLTAALKENDPLKISEAVVRSFISEYFTWTNKDGNYEVGGIQYVYGPKYTSFQEEARWEFYKDLDLYITQFGRENLLEVNAIETPVVDYAADYVIGDQTLKAYYVEATWTYKSSNKIDVNEFQKTGYFTVADNNGRYEIVRIFDKYD